MFCNLPHGVLSLGQTEWQTLHILPRPSIVSKTSCSLSGDTPPHKQRPPGRYVCGDADLLGQKDILIRWKYQK